MRASQVDRAVTAKRAAHRSTVNTGASPSTNLLRRALTPTEPYGFTGTRRHGNKARMTKAQRSAHKGAPNLWSASPYYWTNPTWSK